MSQPFASQHTQSFPALLNYLGVSVLVSTYQAGQLIILRNHDDLLNTHFCSLDKPMGLSVYQDKLAVGTSFQLWEYANLPAAGVKVQPPIVHDACYLPRSVRVTGDIDGHELAYSDTGELWVVNTRMSCLCTLDSTYSVIPRWRPPFVSAFDLTDRCHLNGLALRDGHPEFVTALGKTDTAAGWRKDKASGGLLMRVSDNRIIADGLSMPHSPRWYQDKLWYLESGAGQLCTVNEQTGQRTVIAQLPGFTRGLDFVGRYAFIGLSQVRETAIFSGLPLTSQVAERFCGVWVVDIENGQTIAYVIFTGSVQEIFALQILPQRFPVILDMDDSLIRSAYFLPPEALAEIAKPESVDIAFDTATQYHQNGQLLDAIAAYRQLLAEVPEHIAARFQLGVVLVDLERWSEAEVELLNVLSLQPNHAEAHNSLGLCFAGQGLWIQARYHYEQAIAADHHYALAHVNRALILLKLERFKEGWAEFEWRYKNSSLPWFSCSQPQWQGQSITDKVLLVHTEQGYGDVLQFVRFLPLVAQRCKKLILLCTDNLRPLLVNIQGVAETRVFGRVAMDSFDYFCPLMSLPYCLDIDNNLLADTVPYLSVPAYISVPLLSSPFFKVGLCWAGNADHPNDAHRSCSLSNWLALLAVPDISFYSLQTPLAAADADKLMDYGATNLESELSDFARTAALVVQLDLIICVDTAVAHLAGAFGKPVWLVLGHHSDWRWFLDKDESLWYPSMKLFRPSSPTDDWQITIERVIAALKCIR